MGESKPGDKLREFAEKLENQGIIINRIPQSTREEFKQFAREEFANDYGFALKYLWDHYKKTKLIFENFDYKLDEALERIDILQNSINNSQSSEEDGGSKNLANEPAVAFGSRKKRTDDERRLSQDE